MIPHSSLPIVYPHLLLQCLKHHFVLELLTFSSTDDFALLNIVQNSEDFVAPVSGK
jgi:hypothetical protein